MAADHVPAHVDCPACHRCGRTVAISRHDDGVTPLPSPSLRCPACGALWTASAADRAQAERADAANDVRLAAERVRRWLRSTVPGDLARVVGTGAGVATDDVAAVLDALDAAQRSAATERAQREAAERECARLREAIRRQAAAVRVHESARAQTDAHDAATLRSLAGQDRAALIEELAATRRERDDWNARATAMESDRDAAVAQREALAGAVRREREAEAYHREAVAECERCLSKPRAWWDRAKLEEERAAASLEDARRTLRAALDALLTEGTRSVADEAECDDMASGYFDPMARCPRHRP